jgi:DNA-binding SARP family transcriptional activator
LIPGKARELFCYLLIHRQQPIARESLASTLWGNCTTEHSKSYLRKALWQLQSCFFSQKKAAGPPLLRVDPQWVSIHPEADIWLDVESFETAFVAAQNSSGHDCYKEMQIAADLYQGNLLEGWYQDWCLYERERLQNTYLAMLNKLVFHAEKRHEHQKGIDYGMRILRCDRAHEIAHQQLMRLHYLSGDRASALRQYEHCEAALREELGVQPSERTRELHLQIREDRLWGITTAKTRGLDPREHSHLENVLGRLQELKATLAKLQETVEESLLEIREALPSSVHKQNSSNGSHS